MYNNDANILPGDGYYMTGIGENSADNNLEMLRIALRLKDDSLIAVSCNKAVDLFDLS